MKKDAYYFPHFSNARGDRKLRRVISQLGIEGYGLYFMILEVLREQQDFKYPLSDTDLLADEFKTTQEKIDVIINSYGLFEKDDQGNFYSPKQIEYLRPYLERSERARLASQIRWSKCLPAPEIPKNPEKLFEPDQAENGDANAFPPDSDSNASKVKKSKVKKSKEDYSETEFPIWFNDAVKASWREYIAYRKIKKIEILTAESMKRQFVKISNLSGNNPELAISIISQCIDRGYKGLVPLLNQGAPAGPTGTDYGEYKDIVKSYLNNTEIRTMPYWRQAIMAQFIDKDEKLFREIKQEHFEELKAITEPMKFIEFVINKAKERKHGTETGTGQAGLF